MDNEFVGSRKILFLMIGILILIIILLILGRQIRKSPQHLPNAPTPTPQTYQPQPTTHVSPTQIKELEVISVDPPQDTTKVQILIRRVDFTFNQPISPNQFRYKVDPPTETIVRTTEGVDRLIMISPKVHWSIGITTITILPTTKAISGALLKTPYVYKIKTDFPETAPDNAPGL